MKTHVKEAHQTASRKKTNKQKITLRQIIIKSLKAVMKRK